jgi:hypothetical protein
MLPALPTGSVAELVDDLECCRLLALDAIRIDAVDERHGVVLAELANDMECDVEAPLDAHHRRAMHPRLHQLPGGDVPVRHDHDGAKAEARAVGGR